MTREVKNVNDPSVQMKDFFRSSNSGSQKVAVNAHNILWVLDNYPEEAKKEATVAKYDVLHAAAIDHIRRNINMTEDDARQIQQLLFNEDVIEKRLRVLHEQGGTLKNEAVALARFGSLPLFKAADEFGLDYNELTFNRNYALRTAMIRRRTAIVNYLMDKKDIVLSHLDMSGSNLAQFVMDKVYFAKIEELWNKVPEQFLTRTQNQLTVLEIYAQNNQAFKKIPQKYKKPIENVLLNVMTYFDLSKDPQDIELMKEIASNSFRLNSLSEIYVKMQYNKLHKTLSKQDDTRETSRHKI